MMEIVKIANEILSKKGQIILLVVILFIGVIIMTTIATLSERQFKDVNLIANSDSLAGTVISSIARKGSVVVEFKNSKRYQLPASENENYNPCYINDFIQEGDSLSKAAFCDTLYIYRNKQLYYFVLHKMVRTMDK